MPHLWPVMLQLPRPPVSVRNILVALVTHIIYSHDGNSFISLSATFDVQGVTARASGSEIIITGDFATGSLAVGLFVVLTSDSSSPDEFRAVMRGGGDLRRHRETVNTYGGRPGET